MKTQLTTIFSLFLISVQAQTVTFETIVGDASQEQMYDVWQTADGGYIAAGYRNDYGVAGKDVLIIRLNELGDTLWTKSFGGSGDDVIQSVRQVSASDQGFILAGYTTSFGAGSGDHYLVRIDSLGDTLWTKTFGGTGNDKGVFAIETSDGGFLTVGSLSSGGWGKGRVIKTDANGNQIWEDVVPASANSYADYALENTANEYIIAGGQILSGGDYDVHLRKYDSGGNLLDTKSYDDFYPTAYANNAVVIEPTEDGGYIVGGIIGFLGSFDVWMIKTDANLDSLWSKRFFSVFNISTFEYGYDIRPTPDKGYILSGSKNLGDYNAKLIKTDSLGNVQWSQNYGDVDGDYANSIQVTNDSGYVVGGMFGLNPGAGNYGDAYIFKVDSTGQFACLLTSSISVTSDYNGYDISCATATDGEATVTAQGGPTPYTYLWDAGTGNQTTATANNLAAGTYSVLVADDMGCTDSLVITLTEPNPITAVRDSTLDDGTCNGTASVNVSGGVGPYTYLWDAGSGNQTTAIATDLCTGMRCVTITDANTCQLNVCILVGSSVGGKDDEIQELVFYPSPTNGDVRVAIKSLGMLELKVYNSYGQLIEQIRVKNGDSVPLPDNAGCYFLHCNGIVYKVIKIE